MTEPYGGPVGAMEWGEDMVPHAALMTRGGGVGWRSVQSPPSQTLTWPSTWYGPGGMELGCCHSLTGEATVGVVTARHLLGGKSALLVPVTSIKTCDILDLLDHHVVCLRGDSETSTSAITVSL
ncbi:hypothetical protein GW17_00027570 [Ensete ventricosum]|nr:hypothetical protein GW17_00027570 [Ensete ventricosum]RZR92572.1 hypothetical protein BHM03_00020884 [Ensete ventricosum]